MGTPTTVALATDTAGPSKSCPLQARWGAWRDPGGADPVIIRPPRGADPATSPGGLLKSAPPSSVPMGGSRPGPLWTRSAWDDEAAFYALWRAEVPGARPVRALGLVTHR